MYLVKSHLYKNYNKVKLKILKLLDIKFFIKTKNKHQNKACLTPCTCCALSFFQLSSVVVTVAYLLEILLAF